MTMTTSTTTSGLVRAVDLPKSHSLYRFSDPHQAQKMATRHLGRGAVLYKSPLSQKKYCIFTPEGKRVHFGQMGYEDYTKHKDRDRRQNYLARSGKIAGNWRNDAYSPNRLSRDILW